MFNFKEMAPKVTISDHETFELVQRAETRKPKCPFTGMPKLGDWVGVLAWSQGCCPMIVRFTPNLGVGDFGALIFLLSALWSRRSDLKLLKGLENYATTWTRPVLNRFRNCITKNWFSLQKFSGIWIRTMSRVWAWWKVQQFWTLTTLTI